MADAMERWELFTNGRVWVEVTADRVRGTTRMVSTHGKGAILKISQEDRLMNQDRIRNKAKDPFLNGTLIRVDADQNEDDTTRSTSAKTDDDLTKILAMKQPAKLKAALAELSEVSFRRLMAMSKEDDNLTTSQSRVIKEFYDETWSINKGRVRQDEKTAAQIADEFPVQELRM